MAKGAYCRNTKKGLWLVVLKQMEGLEMWTNKIKCILLLALSFCWSGQIFAYDTTTKILSQVYGSISTACFQDADADNATTTTVDADSASGQKVLNVAATTNFAANDVLVVDPSDTGDGIETCVVASVSAGVSVTCDDNLEITHLGASADPVHLSNRVPIADGTLLTAGRRYVVYCHDGAGAGLACECIMGTEDVAATNVVGTTLFAGEKIIMKAQGSNLAVSCDTFATGVSIDVCPLD